MVKPRAVVDIGSNSVLLLVAVRHENGELTVIRDEATITRISEGAAARGTLSPEAIERTLEVLRRYRKIADQDGVAPGDLQAVATEGLRMGSNSADFLGPASEILGTEVRMISGDEEARLSYRSVAYEQTESALLRVIDIGGASTELVSGYGTDIRNAVSHRIGAVRLSEEYDTETPVGLATMYGDIRRLLAEDQPLAPHPVLHGLAGTVTTVGALVLGLETYDRNLVDKTVMYKSAVTRLRFRLAAMTYEERRAMPLIGPGRADVIVAGVTILLAAMDHCGAETLVVRDRGLRYAMV